MRGSTSLAAALECEEASLESQSNHVFDRIQHAASLSYAASQSYSRVALSFFESAESTAISAVLSISLFFMVLMIIRLQIASNARARCKQEVVAAASDEEEQEVDKTLTREASPGTGETSPTGLPFVSLIMPVQMLAIKSRSPLENWRSQVLCNYRGKVEAIFCVTSAEDEAAKLVDTLTAELTGKVKIQLKVCGDTEAMSQKIHNMLSGLRVCDPEAEYVLFLDPNGKLHPSTVGSLVSELQDDPAIFAATGYTLDLPEPDATVWSWVICQFRYLSLSHFSSSRSDLIWGGAVMMRKADIMQKDMQAWWRNGGYSDDALLCGFAAEHGRAIATPLTALFPNQVKKSTTFCQALDFIYRQVFVLNTYGSLRHWLKHRWLFFSLCPPTRIHHHSLRFGSVDVLVDTFLQS